jgi:hypothetical protein
VAFAGGDYEIRIKGRLSDSVLAAFEGLTTTLWPSSPGGIGASSRMTSASSQRLNPRRPPSETGSGVLLSSRHDADCPCPTETTLPDGSALRMPLFGP